MKYPHIRLRCDVSKPMQSFRSIEVLICMPWSSLQTADSHELGIHDSLVHLFVILAPHMSASAAMTRIGYMAYKGKSYCRREFQEHKGAAEIVPNLEGGRLSMEISENLN